MNNQPFSKRDYLTPLEYKYTVNWWQFKGSFNTDLYEKILTTKKQLKEMETTDFKILFNPRTGDTFALIVDETQDELTVYSIIGQHSTAVKEYINECFEVVDKDVLNEYEQELKTIGYTPNILNKTGEILAYNASIYYKDESNQPIEGVILKVGEYTESEKEALDEDVLFYLDEWAEIADFFDEDGSNDFVVTSVEPIYKLDKTKRDLIIAQIHLSDEIKQKSGINVVTCGNCGSVILHKLSDENINCYDCGNEMSTSDCSDLFYSGMENNDLYNE